MGSTYAQAITNQVYAQYQITTPATLNTATFFDLVGLGSTGTSVFQFAVQASTKADFSSYTTLAQDLTVSTTTGGYQYKPYPTAEYPYLAPSTTYYFRVYLYNRTGSIVDGGVAPNSVYYDDFQIGTALCPTTLRLSKALGGGRVANTDQFTVAIRTGSATGTVVNSTANATTTGTGSTVTAGTGTTGTFNATSGTQYFLTEAGSGGAQLANYAARITCTDANGLQAGLPSGVAFNGSLAITPVRGAAISCTLTNTPSRLTLLKTVVNDNGGTALDTAWTLTATGPTNLSGTEGAAAVTNATVNPGAYTLAETNGPTGYTASQYSCVVNGAAAVVGNNLSLAAGDTVICTITNDDQPVHLTLTKVSNGGTGAFQFAGTNGIENQTITTTAAGGAGTSGTQQTLTAVATATRVTETVPAGWALTGANCTVTAPGGAAQSATGTFDAATSSFNLSVQDTATGNAIACTFTNNRLSQQLSLAKEWGANSPAGHTAGATTAGATNNAGFASTAPTATTGVAATVFAGESVTLPVETFAGGASQAQYDTTVACTGGTTLAASAPPQTIVVSDSATATVCTYTNTPRTATLQLAKAWASGSVDGHRVTIGATTGGINNTTTFDATAPIAANSGNAVTVMVGDVIALPAETGADAANYTTTLACTGGHALSGNDGQQNGNTLTITSTNAAECTYTNTPRTTTLTLRKQWSGATVGDTATVSVSRGGAAVGTLDSRADTSNEVDASATPVTVFAGETLTLQEALAGANTGQYDSALACTGAADTNPDDGLTIAADDGVIVCTFTNTQRTTDLSITKTNTPTSGASDQTADTVVGGTNTTYSVVVTNHAATAVTGAVVRDTPQAGLDCPAANAVTCAGAACPSGAITVGDLTNGVTLGQLAAGATATLSFTCAVQR
ncbi:DUF11 domain-containing protein [Lysobacter sp. K5869]|uniref:prealbumin-like fold domain-containing protein n=1 Tax=Lysobacter sp. K5869 TaxID=2820808 RepID=UPI001C06344E|nr:DUF11 domain-containing protein [Lysobacter sp. K5869]QWP75617.1 DUF11 domain-containing protein [Lysobacter sp. K5869]